MILELHDIHKHFGKIRANDGITLTIEPGCIHGILGENGAGKSTLMKILAGYQPMDSGAILIDGDKVHYTSPREAAADGIGMLYQDPLDFPALSVLENFMLGHTGARCGRRRRLAAELENLSSTFNFPLHPETPVRDLTIGERQQLEIIRLLSLGVQVLILDEPTTGISSMQKQLLFSALKQLAARGRSVILVSHKLEDVEALCDTITVLRTGRCSGAAKRPFVTSELLRMMFGNPPRTPAHAGAAPGGEILRLERVSAPGGRSGLKDCTVGIRQGEVVGLAGLEGSGQDVFLRLAGGMIRPTHGTLYRSGRAAGHQNYHRLQGQGVAFLPAARLEEGLIRGLTITEHCALRYAQGGLLVPWGGAVQKSLDNITRFHVMGRPDSPVESLSGGNQQRLLLSFLPTKPTLLLLENPTRGLDMESVNWVWEHLHAYARQQTSILFSSSELDEILMASDRVLVFFEGRLVMDAPTGDTDILELGRAIAGKPGGAA